MRAAEATEIMTALRHFLASLADAEDDLNAINVFPIADGDTGTNLTRTVQAMISELESTDPQADLTASVALAALNAARGNSGLICAQYVAGLVSVDPEALFTDSSVLARSLAVAATRARSAVAEPVEGTMVSVADVAARAAAEWATERPAPPDSPAGRPRAATPTVASDTNEATGRATVHEARPEAEPAVLLAALSAVVQQAVDHTRHQLPVLTKAGVIDAGAAGLAMLFDALAEVAGAVPDPGWRSESLFSHVDSSKLSPVGHSPTDQTATATTAAAGGGPAILGFELQFTADGPDEVADELRRLLVAHGDSVVVSQAAGIIRAHVHLQAVGPAIEAVLDVVRPRNIEVEPLIELLRP